MSHFAKRANGSPVSPPPAIRAVDPNTEPYPTNNPVEDHYGRQEVADALKGIGLLGAAGLGTGALVGGVKGLSRWMALPYEQPSYAALDREMELPVKRRKRAPRSFSKYAGEATTSLLDALKRPGPSYPGPGAWAKGWHLVNKYPWVGPAGVMAAGGGLAAGYLGANKLVGQRANEDDDQEVEDARAEYEKALLAQQGAKKQAGSASAIDELYEGWAAKEAGLTDLPSLASGVRDTANFLSSASPLSLAATYAVPATAGGLLLGYLGTRKHNQSIVNTALKRRAAMRAMASPPEIHLTPVDVGDEEDEEGPPASPRALRR
jgi:hypothetical protein